MMNIYLTNLGKYNEGFLIGEWVSLPISNEDLKDVLKRIKISDKPDANGNYYEEYFITDWECDYYNIGEYENIDTLNEIASQVESLEDNEKEIAKALMSECGYTLNEAMEKVESGNYAIYYDCEDMIDVAYYIVEECGYLRNVPENVARYFDYEAFARDLSIEGTFIFLEDNKVLEVLY